MMWWSVSPFAADDALEEADTLKLGMHAPRPTGATPPRRWPTQGLARRRLARGLPHRGPRPGRPHRRGPRRRGHRRPPRQRPGHPQPLRRPRLLRLDRARLRRPGAQARRPHRDRPDRAEGRRPRGRPDARPAPQDHRPAHPGVGRLHRPRAARRGPLHRDGAAHRAGRHPRVPGRGVRPRQARPARRPALHPTDQLEQITKYVGGEAPTLHRLGGADWTKTKARAKKAVKEIAADLIKLYSARMAAPGHAFGADTPWQRELEDAFPYAETRTSSPPSPRSRRTWRRRSPWTV